jgi:hypothetical protein
LLKVALNTINQIKSNHSSLLIAWYFQLWRSWYCAITQWNTGFYFT